MNKLKRYFVALLFVLGACTGGDSGDRPDPSEEDGHRLDLAFARTDLRLDVVAGDIGLVLRITNAGPSNVTPISVELEARPGALLRSADCTPSEGVVVTCVALSHLAPRKSVEVTLPVELVGSSASRTVTVSVFVDVDGVRVEDLNPGDNTTTVSF